MTRRKVHDLLERGEVVSGEKIGEKLGISRAAVWKHIEALREQGYEILSTSEGYLLREGTSEMNEIELTRRLGTETLGRNVVIEDAVSSTNDEAKRLAEAGEPEGTVVIARRQGAGRGRVGKNWVSPEGGLYLSVILRPRIDPTEAPKMTLLAGLAVAETLRDLGVDARIKWSNDVVLGGRKVSGVLTEMAAEENAVKYVVLGVGINANLGPEDLPEELRKDSAFLREELGHDVDLRDLAASLLGNLETRYDQFREKGFRPIRDAWRELSETLGREVRIETRRENFIGHAVGLSRDGALVVELPDGELKRVTGGLCRHVESY